MAFSVWVRQHPMYDALDISVKKWMDCVKDTIGNLDIDNIPNSVYHTWADRMKLPKRSPEHTMAIIAESTNKHSMIYDIQTFLPVVDYNHLLNSTYFSDTNIYKMYYALFMYEERLISRKDAVERIKNVYNRHVPKDEKI